MARYARRLGVQHWDVRWCDPAASILERGPFGSAEANGSEPVGRNALCGALIDTATRVTMRLRPAVSLLSLERELPG